MEKNLNESNLLGAESLDELFQYRTDGFVLRDVFFQFLLKHQYLPFCSLMERKRDTERLIEHHKGHVQSKNG